MTTENRDARGGGPPGSVLRLAAYPQAELPAELARQVAGIEARAWPGSRFGHDPLLRPRCWCCSTATGWSGLP
ncbi:hypothetical protein Sros01_69470 [Streptomyces roseochromogenus]|nr:hypothetical protein Sros01_69470 [Streptomyces roseochromogenus]